jgi:AcrR family transcriptional regulator
MASRSRSSQREGTARRRDDIMAVACELFARNGFAGTNIQDICAATGLSVGTLYHHFGSKEELLATTYLTVLNRYQAGALPLLDSTAPAEVVVKETVLYHLSWLIGHPTEARFLLQFIGADQHIEAAPPELVKENEEFLAAVKAWLESAMNSREIKRMSFRSVVALLIGPIHLWVRDWVMEQEPVDLASVADILADGSWAALRGSSYGPGLTLKDR